MEYDRLTHHSECYKNSIVLNDTLYKIYKDFDNLDFNLIKRKKLHESIVNSQVSKKDKFEGGFIQILLLNCFSILFLWLNWSKSFFSIHS